MRRKSLALAAAIVCCAGHASAQSIPPELITAEGGVLCFSPINLREGIAAANRGDLAWTKEVGCIRTRAGVPIARVDPDDNPSQLRPWQVRVMPPNAPHTTMWGYAPSFTLKNGARVWRGAQ